MESDLDKILTDSFPKDIPIKCINYKGLFVPETYELIADAIEKLEVRDDDVWVCSFPKTGTTWTQEMVWNIANDLNFEGAKVSLLERFPHLEVSGATSMAWIAVNILKEDVTTDSSVIQVANLPSPRFIKTHLPFHLLPRQIRTGEKKPKIVYVARNPKDACISYYHHYKLLEGYCGNFENFCKLFLGDKVYCAPFWDHVTGYWEIKDKRNILCLKYEDMKADLPSVIRRTAEYLGKNLSDDQVNQLEKHLSFSSMKKNPSVNYEPMVEMINETKFLGENFIAKGDFMRKGVSGQWKETMSEEVIKQFDAWTAEKLKNFQYLKKEFP